jgi:hypothetical protein
LRAATETAVSWSLSPTVPFAYRAALRSPLAMQKVCAHPAGGPIGGDRKSMSEVTHRHDSTRRGRGPTESLIQGQRIRPCRAGGGIVEYAPHFGGTGRRAQPRSQCLEVTRLVGGRISLRVAMEPIVREPGRRRCRFLNRAYRRVCDHSSHRQRPKEPIGGCGKPAWMACFTDNGCAQQLRQ